MSLKTHSRFIYGFEVTPDTQWVDFSEGAGPELSGALDIGSYTLGEMVIALSALLNGIGALTYTVDVDRLSQIVTISATGVFSLKLNSGSHSGTSAMPLLGFIGSPLTGASTYSGSLNAGTSYTTQFILQSYVSPDHYKASAYGVVNKSASGQIETITYGQEVFFECNIQYVNDNDNGDVKLIRSRPSGVEQLVHFMDFITTKSPLEFMPDENDTGVFIPCQLESTPDDKNGLKYKLKEMYSKNLPGYFETGTLTFRVKL